MSDENKHGNAKVKHYTPLPIDNPEVSRKKDWWDDLCKAHGAKNYWKKDNKKGGK